MKVTYQCNVWGTTRSNWVNVPNGLNEFKGLFSGGGVIQVNFTAEHISEENFNLTIAIPNVITYILTTGGKYYSVKKPQSKTYEVKNSGFIFIYAVYDLEGSYWTLEPHYYNDQTHAPDFSILLGSIEFTYENNNYIIRSSSLLFNYTFNNKLYFGQNKVNNDDVSSKINNSLLIPGTEVDINLQLIPSGTLQQGIYITHTNSAMSGYIFQINGTYISLSNDSIPLSISFDPGVSTYYLIYDTTTSKLNLIKYNTFNYDNQILLGTILVMADSNGVPSVYSDDIRFEHSINGIKAKPWREQTASAHVLSGKKLSILGDSISTYSGYIPSGHAAFFPRSGYDVDSVNKTWWKKLLDYTGMILETNESWSGSRIATPPAGRTEVPFSNDARLENLGNPDVIIVFGGINDEFAQSDPTTPGTLVESTQGVYDVTKFISAYQYVIRKLQTTYVNAKIFVCAPTFLANNTLFEKNSVNWSQYDMHKCISDLADYYGVGFIDLPKCGINRYNYTTYLDDTVHPKEAGMNLIFNKVLGSLLEYYAH